MKKALWYAGSAALATMLAGGAAFAQAAGGTAGGYQNPNQNQPMGAQPSTPSMGTPMTQGTATQVPLTQVSDLNTLNSASVQDKDGNSVGSVRKVITSSGGKPSAVQVDAGGFLGVGTKIVAIKASHLKYERDRNVLITNLTKDEIKALPAATGM
jgi:hypothetical protein